MARRYQPNQLTAYRRHAGTCKETNITKCKCVLWVHGRLRGKIVRRSLNTASLARAEARIEEMLEQAKNGKSDSDPEPPSGGGIQLVDPGNVPGATVTLEYAEQDFNTRKSTKASGTRGLYARAVAHFRRYAEAHGLTLLRQIDTVHLQQYFQEYREWRRNTAQSRLIHLRVFFNHCKKKRRWITDSPASDPDLNFGKSAKTTGTRKPLTPKEVTKVLAAIEQLPVELRDRARAAILLLLFTGMRVSDLTFVEREYLNERNTLDYYVIKTRRLIDLPPELQKPVLDALAKLPPSRVYFFQPDRDDDYCEARQALRGGEEFGVLMPDYTLRIKEMRQLVVQVLTLAGIKGACHKFRDTFAINMLVGGADIFTVSQMLGHADVKITQDHYLKAIPGYRERMSQWTKALAYQFPLAA